MDPIMLLILGAIGAIILGSLRPPPPTIIYVPMPVEPPARGAGCLWLVVMGICAFILLGGLAG